MFALSAKRRCDPGAGKRNPTEASAHPGRPDPRPRVPARDRAGRERGGRGGRVLRRGGGRGGRGGGGGEPRPGEVEALAADRPCPRRLLPDGGLRHAAEGSKRRLVWVTAKGLGVGPNDLEPGEEVPEDTGSATSGSSARYYFKYLPEQVFGMSGVLRFPSDSRLAKLTPRASEQIRPTNARAGARRTRRSPPDGPIKHVFYIVRENRTYDQILGDDPRGDGDPKLTLFGEEITPNAHALAKRFPLLDHVYANSEASIDGPLLDRRRRGPRLRGQELAPELRGRERPYDFGVYSVTWPSQGFLFDQAAEQGISCFNFGEAVAGTVPLADVDRDARGDRAGGREVRELATSARSPRAAAARPAPCYPTTRRMRQERDHRPRRRSTRHRPAGADPLTPRAASSASAALRLQHRQRTRVPTFTYMVLPNDHTEGTTPGRRTPRAMIAENDYALGQFVDKISHSSIWESVADPRDRGRLPGRRRPRRRPPDPGPRDLPVREARGGRPHALRLPLVHPHARARHRMEPAQPLRRDRHADVRRLRRRCSDNSEPYEAIIPDVDPIERNTARVAQRPRSPRACR